MAPEAIEAAIIELRDVWVALGQRSPRWKPGPRRSEDSLREFEQRLGAPLPIGYRTYLREIGDGGRGLADAPRPLHEFTADEIERARKPFPLTRAWYSPDPFNIKLCKKFGLYDERKDLFVELPEGVEPTDGTLLIGAPTGTHEYHVLVVAGPHAGEVWVDATGEDTGGVTPLAPDFLSASLDYLRAILADYEAG